MLYIGVSDAPAWWVAQANTLAELRGWSRFAGLQIEYSLAERTVERELIPMAKAFELGVLA
ncbi:MAG: aldo/keto reductase [Bryobacteraceae bacterium]